MRDLENLANFLTKKPPIKWNKPQFAPSYEYMQFVRLYKEPQRLVHITDKQDLILQEGFKNCVADFKKLGLTKWLGKKHRGDDGYVFCFPEGSIHIEDSLGIKYGDKAVSFTAPFILVQHYNDQEMQAITHTSLITDLKPYRM